MAENPLPTQDALESRNVRCTCIRVRGKVWCGNLSRDAQKIRGVMDNKCNTQGTFWGAKRDLEGGFNVHQCEGGGIQNVSHALGKHVQLAADGGNHHFPVQGRKTVHLVHLVLDVGNRLKPRNRTSSAQTPRQFAKKTNFVFANCFVRGQK